MNKKSIIGIGCILIALGSFSSVQAATINIAANGPDVSHEGLDYERQMVAKSKTKSFHRVRNHSINTCISSNSRWVPGYGCKKLSHGARSTLQNKYRAAKKTCRNANGTWIEGDGCHFRR